MKNLKLYLDMDGVICNFSEKFESYYGPLSLSKRDRKEWSKDWEDFILDKKGFEHLEWFPGGEDLLKFIRKEPNFYVEILTSSGGEKFHREVAAQKIKWLRDKSIDYKANVVPGRKHKAEYAKGNSTILIDDTEDIIVNFNRAGGIGILHRDLGETVKSLQSLLEKY